MFNQLTATETVAAMGRAARAAAREQGTLSEFERGQLMSAFSASRHLAVELASYDAVLREFAAALGLGEVADAAQAGELTCRLLEAGVDDPERLTTIRTALRELADREVDLLAAAIEEAPKR